jgi:hypothetical protein
VYGTRSSVAFRVLPRGAEIGGAGNAVDRRLVVLDIDRSRIP